MEKQPESRKEVTSLDTKPHLLTYHPVWIVIIIIIIIIIIIHTDVLHHVG
jgi:hypothetical protein